MTCYMRHMNWLFDELALESDKKNRARVDAALRKALAVPEDAGCPEVWASVKRLSDDERFDLASSVAEALELH
jgi:hypothetical protein